jgi:ABC-type transport system involved in cytochrome bd biosynthesis fused ATPase/permease subunit
MSNNACETYSRQYAQFVSKEVMKAAAADIFDNLRRDMRDALAAAPGKSPEELAEIVMETLSDVEVAFYNDFDLAAVFEEVTSR